MKTIKRTTIKIRQRELIAVSTGEQNEHEENRVCPLCRMSLAGREILIEETKKAAQIAVQSETETR